MWSILQQKLCSITCRFVIDQFAHFALHHSQRFARLLLHQQPQLPEVGKCEQVICAVTLRRPPRYNITLVTGPLTAHLIITFRKTTSPVKTVFLTSGNLLKGALWKWKNVSNTAFLMHLTFKQSKLTIFSHGQKTKEPHTFCYGGLMKKKRVFLKKEKIPEKFLSIFSTLDSGH